MSTPEDVRHVALAAGCLLQRDAASREEEPRAVCPACRGSMGMWIGDRLLAVWMDCAVCLGRGWLPVLPAG